MILWLIALAIVASVAVVGYYQGALRAAFSFVGLLLAASLATSVGGGHRVYVSGHRVCFDSRGV
jgi:uncharacterized membrane protein required for colicin V production